MTTPPNDDKNPPPPDQPQPTLSYRAPRDEPQSNTPKQFILRSLAGLGIGVAALIIGGILAGASGIPVFLLLPLVVAIGLALTISIRTRRFGYTTGILVAPIFLVGVAAVLLLIICGINGLNYR